MNETASKNFPFAKALGYLTGALAAVAVAFGLTYAACYVVAYIVNVTLTHGQLDVPMAALGFWAIGVLVRYFAKQPKPKQPKLQMPNFTPADLADFRKRLDDVVTAESARKPTPYL